MSRVALDFGFIQIYWYSIFILLGILIGSVVAYIEIKKKKIDVDFYINLLFYGIVFGLIGARVYYCLFNLDYFLANPLQIFEVWNGGLAIHGGIIVAVLFFIYYCRKYKQNTLKIIDVSVVGLIIGQAIGRWGNFFNQEVYGMITTKDALLNQGVPEFIVDGMFIDGAYRQPVFLYEIIWNVVGFIAMLIIRKYRYLKVGQLTGFYLMWYSAGRFVIEAFRNSSYILMIGPFKIAQLTSVLLFVIGLVLFLKGLRGSHFENLYKEEEAHEE